MMLCLRHSGQASHHSRPTGATSLRTKWVTSLLRKQKHHLYPFQKQNIVSHTIPCKQDCVQKGRETATCDKAGSPTDVCPDGQVMSASPNDVAYGYDVVPAAQWANITSLRPSGATSLRTKWVTSLLHKQKHHLYYIPSENKISYNTLCLASKIVCKRGEKISSLFCFDIKLLYGRCPQWRLFLI